MCGYTSQGIFHEGLLQIQQILYQGMGSLGVESWTHAGRAKVREVKTTSRACSLFPPRTTLVLCIRGVLYMHILLVVCIEYFMHITIEYTYYQQSSTRVWILCTTSSQSIYELVYILYKIRDRLCILLAYITVSILLIILYFTLVVLAISSTPLVCITVCILARVCTQYA